MMRIVAVCLLLSGLIVFPSPLPAQAPNEPQITLLQSSPQELYADVESIFNLTGAADQKQWGPFKNYLDLMLEGIDPALPIRYDIITDGNRTRYRPGFGISSKDDFLKSLSQFGIKNRRRLQDYYTLDGAFAGHLRFVEAEKVVYAIIGEERDDVPRGFFPLDNVLKQYGLADDGVTCKQDTLALLINSTPNFAARRTSYTSVKDEIMAGVSQKEGESTANFELRKGLLGLQIDELGRYFADSQELAIGWTTDAASKSGQLALKIVPIPASPLAQTIAESSSKPSYFTALIAPETAILAGSMYFPLDAQQRANLREVVRLIKGRLESEVRDSQDETPEQKAAFQAMLNEFEAAADTGLKTDSLDGFVHVWPGAEGKHTAVGGLMMSEAEKMLNVLNQFQVARPKSKVSVGIETVGDVALHSLELAEEHRPALQDFFGSHTLYVGIGPNAVWYGIGPEALEGLKSRIQTVADAKDIVPSKKIFSVKLQAAPFIAWRNRYATPDDPSQSSMPIRTFLAESVVPGEDLLTMDLTQTDEGAVGTSQVSTGFLRFVGRIMARFSKENLPQD